MKTLLALLRASHCRSTHHYFAIDALPLVQTDAGRRLKGLLLRHHGDYLRGATDPDTRFCDFQNHVIHTDDGYWGGAPRVAHAWYDRLQRYLRTGKHQYAAHAAGVLSHYFTDVLMPLHTRHDDRERVLHLPIQWSVEQTYDQILADWKNDDLRVVFNLSDGPGWLGEAMLHAARYASAYYEPLLDTYDLEAAQREPSSAFGLVSRRLLAELFGLAITGWARVLERAATDAELVARKPIARKSSMVGLSIATMRAPVQLVGRRFYRGSKQRTVDRLVSEFRNTGDISKNLPAEVDIVHRVARIHRDETAWRALREARLASQKTTIGVEVGASNVPKTQTSDEPMILPFRPLGQHAGVVDRSGINRDDGLDSIPSVDGPIADRLAAIGIHSVGQLIDCDAPQTAAELMTYWITADKLRSWQAEAAALCSASGSHSGQDSQATRRVAKRRSA